MTGSIWSWSTTAASNGNADAGINAAEGMPPSAVNDSMRQIMGREAEFLADTGGALAVGGTANAITVTANSAFTAYANNLQLAIRIASDNAAGGVTLNANGLGNKAIRIMAASGETDPPAGALKAGCIANLRYGTSFNGGAGAWMLQNPVVDVPNLVTLTGTQTLTNKTLTNPAINTPTISGGSASSIALSPTTITDSGPFALTGVISPSALASGSTHNWAPTGLATASTIRVTTNSAGSTLTGITAQAGGTVVLLQNLGPGPLILAGNNAGSSAANQFDNIAPVSLFQGQSSVLWYDGTASGWQIAQAQAASPSGAVRKNLKITTGSATSGTITADELVLEDANGATYRASSVNVSYATGTSGANGLDTGTITASNWYFEWVIYNPTTLTAAALLSLSSTAPTMPSGYTFKVRVGAIYYDSGAKLRFKVQYDRRAQIVVGTNPTTALIAVSGTSGSPTTPTWTAVAVGSYVPSTAATIRVALSGFSSGPTTYIIAAPNNSYGAATSSSNPPPLQAAVKNGGEAIGIYSTVQGEFFLESTNIYYASAAPASALAVLGWEDNI
ncbi:hypothetical protein EN814_18945 [Mesorhizobium sp. M2D.F.Ca.ET.171.01.1.1]|uniref:hypothetical protein n=1 Tax=unclassified Mesorhizobium TaxID=325217 RepID=UPI001092FA76|nr:MULTISPECIES: hypothetical protein [unclassified Mesorhizobium]TGS94781.1 hypothetical protein EN821_18960 [Mesorhizobium sp. M2D.F.Ca.ET.178.01.1.1]TGT10563.1 hypothetical protein EN814_18945 [Mesorhizobium sp. M2D.F.Ca.ET.171.01.1.1]